MLLLYALSSRDVQSLQPFLGLVNFCGCFIPNFSSLLHPLHNLLQKGASWSWSDVYQFAFENVKKSISASSLLVHYSHDLHLVLEVDASPYSIGGCFYHVSKSGEQLPVYFVSRALTSAEKNYSQIDREGLAIVFAVKRLHQFLNGQHFSIQTDHEPFIRILGKNVRLSGTVVAHLQRWAVLLSSYNYSLEHIKGVDNTIADCLSRLPQPVSQEEEVFLIHAMNEFTGDPCGDIPILAKDVAKAINDPVLSCVIWFLRSGWPSNIEERLCLITAYMVSYLLRMVVLCGGIVSSFL